MMIAIMTLLAIVMMSLTLTGINSRRAHPAKLQVLLAWHSLSGHRRSSSV
jgi:hypothetical protein